MDLTDDLTPREMTDEEEPDRLLLLPPAINCNRQAVSDFLDLVIDTIEGKSTSTLVIMT